MNTNENRGEVIAGGILLLLGLGLALGAIAHHSMIAAVIVLGVILIVFGMGAMAEGMGRR